MISPMHITSMSVSGLIFIMGTINNPNFVFIRLMLVFVGCVLGILISCVLFPRDYCKMAFCEIKKTTASLLDYLQCMMDGVPCGCDFSAMRSKIAVVQSDVNAYRDEVTRRRYKNATISADMLRLLYESQQPLLHLASNWEKRREQLSDGFFAGFRSALLPVVSAHRLLLDMAENASAPTAFALPALPVPVYDAETVLAALLIEYYEGIVCALSFGLSKPGD
jgi:hypothetical protein